MEPATEKQLEYIQILLNNHQDILDERLYRKQKTYRVWIEEERLPIQAWKLIHISKPLSKSDAGALIDTLIVKPDPAAFMTTCSDRVMGLLGGQVRLFNLALSVQQAAGIEHPTPTSAAFSVPFLDNSTRWGLVESNEQEMLETLLAKYDTLYDLHQFEDLFTEDQMKAILHELSTRLGLAIEDAKTRRALQNRAFDRLEKAPYIEGIRPQSKIHQLP